jgi:small subunit ribosomal protein S21
MAAPYARRAALSSVAAARATIWTAPPAWCIRPHSPERRRLSGLISFCLPVFPDRTRRAAKGERPLVQIFVRDNNVDQALKALKKKMQREGSFREMKRHVHYEKPSEKRARQKAEAVRRARKLARKRAQREGLLPAPKPRAR